MILSRSEDYDAHRDHDMRLIQIEYHEYQLDENLRWTGDPDQIEDAFDTLSVFDHGRVYCKSCTDGFEEDRIFLDAIASFAS